MVLTQARLDHIDRILQLEEQGFPEHIRESRQTFESRLRGFPRGFFMAWDGHRVPLDPNTQALGYFYAEVWQDGQGNFSLGHDPLDCIDPTGTTLYIASMTIDPTFRRGGLGRELFVQGIAAMKQEFPQLKQAVLMVREDWTGARRIYESSGFRVVDRREGLLGPMAALIMEAPFTAVHIPLDSHPIRYDT